MKTDSGDVNSIVCAKLSIERSQTYLSHLHALMFLCDPKDLGMDAVMAENARRIMSAIRQELKLSAQSLPVPGEKAA
ncbi:MAG: hypothetical protein EOM26_09265 [Alphaproteobacteria bacterium]|nr:hypothetical protein [Alphaproteobacteria bacterium]